MEDNYKSIFKGTMLFGGVQIFQILVSFLRNKLNAIFLGPEGLGIYGLYNSSLTIIITIATMGFSSSAVRFIANEADDEKKKEIIKNSRYLLVFLAFIGLLITVMVSYFLSYSTFGSKDYWVSYIVLSLFPFFSIINNGSSSILQGKQETKRIAKDNILSSTICLILSIPLLFFFRLKAIIPIIIIAPFISSILFNHSIDIVLCNSEIGVSKNKIWTIAKRFISYGFVVTVAQLIGTLVDYFINIYVSKTGTITDIGYYNSGMSLTYQCIGLVFNAMMMDYSPKLTSVCENREKANDLINQQGVVTLLIATPILCFMMITSPLLIKLFLSSRFLPITSFIQIIVLGMVFKAISFCLGCVSFARGDKKVFFFYEGVYGSIQRFIFSIIGYKLGGLIGLAWAFLCNFSIYLITVYFLCVKKYKFSPNLEYLKVTLFSLIVSIVIFILTRFPSIYSIFMETFVLIVVIIICLIQLEKRIRLVEVVRNKIFKKR